MRNRIVAIVGLLVLIGAIVFVRAALRQPSDEEQIRYALEQAIIASREGRPGGVFEFMSSSFEMNRNDVGTSRTVADYIRNSKPSIDFAEKALEVRGATAKMVGDATVRIVPILPNGIKIEGVTISFQRERAMRYLVIPGSQWRIVAVEAPNVDPSIFANTP